MESLTGPDRQKMLRQLWTYAEYAQAWARVPIEKRPKTRMVKQSDGSWWPFVSLRHGMSITYVDISEIHATLRSEMTHMPTTARLTAARDLLDLSRIHLSVLDQKEAVEILDDLIGDITESINALTDEGASENQI
jgi:hypothetical protein